MATTKKILKRTAIGVATVLVGVPLVLLAINAFDEELLPEAVAYADLSDLRVPDDENGYFALLALTVPANEDPHTRGKQISDRINRLLESNPKEMPNPAEMIGSGRLHAVTGLNDLCSRDSTNCLARYRERKTVLEGTVGRNRLLLQRYRSLYRYPHFRETITPHLLAPAVIDSAGAARLARAESVLRFLRGDIRGSLQQLHEDTLFWRKALRDSPSLVTRMIAIAMIQINVQVIGEMITEGALNHANLSFAANVVTPLTTSERDLEKVFRFEFALHKAIVSSIGTYGGSDCSSVEFSDCVLGRASETVLFRRNATLNDTFRGFQVIVEDSRLPANEFWKRAVRARQQSYSDAKAPWKWHYVYNPVGKLFNAMGFGGTLYYGYIARIHNLDGYLRLATLQIRLAQEGAGNDNVSEQRIARYSGLYNPYTLEPMELDTSRRTIVFHGYDDKSRELNLTKRFEIRL